jgi:peroxiredoxin
MPEFRLPSVDGSIIDRSYFDGAQVSLVIFTCNHCPYVKGSEGLLLKTVRPALARGLRVVAISSNDPVQYPEDGFDKMKEKARDLELPFPYCFDESQEVARAFDAQCTPECYLFDGQKKLVFHGAISDSPRDPSKVSREYLAIAIEQALNGGTPDPSFAHPIGCSIKWKA